MIRLRYTIAGALAFCLGACVSVLPEADPAAARYGIEAVGSDALSGDGAPAGWSLAIEDPVATRAIDVSKIALVKSGSEYAYYAGGEWSDRAPRLVQLALVRSFQNSGRIVAVGGRTSQPIADFGLQLDVRSFEADATGALSAHVAIYARLTDVRGEVYGARLFEARRPVARDNPAAVASALNEVMTELTPQIVDWAIVTGSSSDDARQSRKSRRRGAIDAVPTNS